MIESDFSGEQAVTLPQVAPAAPAIANDITVSGRSVTLTVRLPSTAVDGGPVGDLARLKVFYKESSFAGSTPQAEAAVGTPAVTVDLLPGQQRVEVEVPGLVPGKTYFFVASCEARCLT